MSNNPEITKEYYDTDYYQKHVARLKHGNRFTRIKLKRVFSLLQPRQADAVVDLGSGVGTIMTALSKAGVNITGIDYSKHSLAIAKENFKQEFPQKQFKGICCDSRNIGLKEASFDGVAAVDFTEHLDDQFLLPTVSEVFRILKRGGKFIIYTPNYSHLFEKLKKHNIILKEDKSHIGLRSMKEYLALLQKCGFTIKEAYFEPTHIPVFNILEKLLIFIPGIGNLAKRRICICAVK